MEQAISSQVVFTPHVQHAMQEGIDQIARAVRPTLGPQPRLVAIDRILEHRMPELLDCGGTIARRIIQIVDRDADVGAMFMRDFLCRLLEQAGDGTATAAVLFHKIYNDSLRFLAAGGNANRLRVHLNRGLEIILNELERLTLPLASQERCKQVACSVCHDPDLSALLAEIFFTRGPWGRLEIRSGRGRENELEYLEGTYWEKGLVSREMIVDHARLRTDIKNAAILISDLEFEEPQQLFPAMVLALHEKLPGLLIVAKKFSPKVIGFLLSNRKPDIFQVIAVGTPGSGPETQAQELEDLALLTGGRSFLSVLGDNLNHMRPEDLGHAGHVWANQYSFGILDGRGDPQAIHAQISRLQEASLTSESYAQAANFRKRVGKLMGGAALLWVGGASEYEITARKEIAEKTASVVQSALWEGFLPGGGACLLACRHALQELSGEEPEARAARKILSEALSEPAQVLITNGGLDASAVLAEVERSGPGYGCDITSGKVVDMLAAGIIDSAHVQKSAVKAAVQSAALALTVDVIVHR